MMVASVLKSLVVLAALSPAASSSAEPIHSITLDRPTQASTGEMLAGRVRPEVRLRKLHLVRPDLIPYPIAYDVYC